MPTDGEAGPQQTGLFELLHSIYRVISEATTNILRPQTRVPAGLLSLLPPLLPARVTTR